MADTALGVVGFAPVVAKEVVDFWKGARSYESDMKELREDIDTLSGMLERLRDSGFLQQGGKAPENLGRKLDHLRGVLEKYSYRGPSGKPSKWKKAPKKFLHAFRRGGLLEDRRSVMDEQMNLQTEMLMSQMETLHNQVKDTKLLISRTKEIGDGVQRIEQGVEELRMGGQQQRKVTQRDEFLDWLSAPDTHGDHCRVREGIDPDSGSWIFDMPQVSKWLANEEADIVWIHGSPGAGKSVIASNVVERAQKDSKDSKDSTGDPSVAVAYIYHDMTNPDKFNWIGRIRTAIIWQLCCALKEKEIPNEVMELSDPPRSPAALKAEQIIRLAQEFRLVYLVIDGLNEWLSELRRELLDLLLELNRDARVKFKISITSTFEKDIETKLQGYKVLNLEDENDNVIHEIKEVMERKVECRLRTKVLCLQDPGLKHEIVSTLSNSSQGIFLWAKLALDELCEESAYRQDECTLKVLHKIPKGMKALYKRMLEKIPDHGDRSEFAKQILGWLVYAKRPFLTLELENALSDSGRVRIRNIEWIIGACRGLVVRRRDRLELVHTTLKEHLEEEPETRSWILQAPLAMTEACVNCLSAAVRYLNDHRGPDAFGVCHQRPFLQHAADHWGHYAALAQQYPGFEDIAPKIAKSLADESVAVALGQFIWPDSQVIDSGSVPVLDGDFARPLGGQHLLAYFGLPKMLRDLIEKDKMKLETAPEHDGGRTPLSWAAGNGHLECVQILWEEYSNHRNLGDDEGISPFSWAAIHGRDDIITWLSQKEGLQACSKDNEGRTAMSYAAECGHNTTIRVLRGIDRTLVNIPDEDGHAPVFWAAGSNHVDTVRIFIHEFRCKPNITTLLSHAAKNGSVDIVRYLVDTFPTLAEPCPRVLEETPLLLAVEHGHKNVVEILDSHWTKWEDDEAIKAARKKIYGLALFEAMHAISRRSTRHEMVKFILPKADVNFKHESGRTPLIAAAEAGLKDIVQLLLADPRVKQKDRDETGSTALGYARHNGHTSIVNMLEDMEGDDWVSDDEA